MNGRQVLALLLAGSLAALFACGGDGGPTSPPPPPGPPPPPPIGASLDLAPGERRVLSGDAELRAFEIVGAAGAREYQVVVVSASQVDGSVTPIVFETRAAGGSAAVTSGRGAGRLGSAAAVPPRPAVSLDDRARPRRRHLQLHAAANAELRRAGARPARPGGPRGDADVRASRASATRVPSVGESVVIKSAILPGGGLSCNSNTPIDATVRAVGQNFAIVEDDAAAGAFQPSDFADLDRELDDFVAPVDHAYFGAPADLDGNGRTIAFFTRQVNRLADPEGGTIVLGFFTNVDLADPVDCPSSNEAEIIWLLAPDPDGETGPAIPVDFVKSIARGLVAHEFQHLLNAQQRVTLGNGDFGDTEFLWLNEGLSHLAEEVTGLGRIGAGTRANLGFAEISGGAVEMEAFIDFHRGNFLNVQDYFTSPNTTAAIAETSAGFDTRGFGYAFLRWLGDRYGPSSSMGVLPGSGEEALFRELASGGPQHLRGIDNVLRAIETVSGESPAWDDVLSEYLAVPAVDDADVGGLGSEVQFATWDFPRLFEELRQSSVQGLSTGYPLARTNVAMGTAASRTVPFDLAASTARYFAFEADGSHPDMIVELSAPSGAAVPNGARARVVVVRTR